MWDKYKEIHEDCAKYILAELLRMAHQKIDYCQLMIQA